MARRHQWNTLTDQGGNDVYVELVDLVGVKERSDQLAAAHHPDVFSRRGAQTVRKSLHGFRHEFHAWRRPFRRLPREHVVRELPVEHHAFANPLFVIVEKPVVGLASPQDGVNRRVECARAVIELCAAGDLAIRHRVLAWRCRR